MYDRPPFYSVPIVKFLKEFMKASVPRAEGVHNLDTFIKITVREPEGNHNNSYISRLINKIGIIKFISNTICDLPILRLVLCDFDVFYNTKVR